MVVRHGCPPLRFLSLSLVLAAGSADAAVERTAHNLAAEASAQSGKTFGVCVFCHTPHNARPTRALWNRAVPGISYKLYESPTLTAAVNQPTGSSRMCLSCHDGTIALEDLRVQPRGTRGQRVFLGNVTGRGSLGMDLSDDHPISFPYDTALALVKRDLVDPSILPGSLKLDATRQIQCVTCHDPHEDRIPKFLVMENRFSQLCLSCHRPEGWAESVHAVSSAGWRGAGVKPPVREDFNTVAENGCGNCHRAHSAGRPQWLLSFSEEEKNCLICHNGKVASKDVEREFRKFSNHPVERTEWLHKPQEDPRLMTRHVTCGDCHNPHRVTAASAAATSLPNALRAVPGVDASGARVAQATSEYEVCYSCHGVTEQSRTTVIRQDQTVNARLEFDPANPSYHPVVAPGRNRDVTGFEGGYSASSRILCGDCHGSDGSPPVKGPHGSRYEPILQREYQAQDPNNESPQAYALCYKCHNRAALLNNPTGFPHGRHLVNGQAPCAACHDVHGSRRNPGLINFMILGKAGEMVVSASKAGRLEFQRLAPSKGQCFLSCHGNDHSPKTY